jgi:serine/threonine-protein kinase ULK/ATG1
MIKKTFIDNEMINKIDKEIEILMKLKDHPNIVNLKNIRKTQNNIYLIFEYCENGDLE